MRHIRLGVLVALIAVVGFANGVALGADKKKGNKVFHGEVVDIRKTDNSHGHFRVYEWVGGVTNTAVIKTFHVNNSTHLIVGNGKGKKPKDNAKRTLDHLRVGHKVVIHYRGEHAVSVKPVK